MQIPNLMQERQSKVACDIQVQGVDNFGACLDALVTLNDVWRSECKTSHLNMLGYARKAVKLEGQTLEEGVVAALLKLDFKLLSLQVEIHESQETREWGLCDWIPAHANYLKPVHEYVEECEFPANLFHAMFRTEHAGDRHFSLFADEWHREGVRLLPRSLIYHKVVFARPKGDTRDLNTTVRFSPGSSPDIVLFPA